MLSFIVTDITQGGAGPVIHLTEPAGGGEAKIELYLPKGYDVPSLGTRFSLEAEEPYVSGDPPQQANQDPLPNADAQPSSDAAAQTATTDPILDNSGGE